MPITPVNGTVTETATETAHKKALQRSERDDVARAPAAAAASFGGPGPLDARERGIRKVVEVQKQDGASEVRKTIDKFV